MELSSITQFMSGKVFLEIFLKTNNLSATRNVCLLRLLRLLRLIQLLRMNISRLCKAACSLDIQVELSMGCGV